MYHIIVLVLDSAFFQVFFFYFYTFELQHKTTLLKLLSNCSLMVFNDVLHILFCLEREYQCVGGWEEDDLIYTYTRRFFFLFFFRFFFRVASLFSSTDYFFSLVWYRPQGSACSTGGMITGWKISDDQVLRPSIDTWYARRLQN